MDMVLGVIFGLLFLFGVPAALFFLIDKNIKRYIDYARRE